MKKSMLIFCAMLLVFGLAGMANAELITVGTANYLGTDYSLIYEDNSIYGGLVWLDYHRDSGNWQDQVNWANGLGGDLTINLDPGYTTTIDWGTGWRLPDAGDNPQGGYNQNTSEMGHLYYDSLGKLAFGPLGDASPFTSLRYGAAWFGTLAGGDCAWTFGWNDGDQWDGANVGQNRYALAVHGGDVSPVPIPTTMLLLGSGLVGLAGFRRKFKKA